MRTVTYKYRLKDKRSASRLREYAYACNQVWNWCVAQHRDAMNRYRAGGQSAAWRSYFGLSAACNGVGALLGINQQTVREVCRVFTEARCATGPGFRRSFGSRRSRGWIPFQERSRQVSGNSVTYLGRTYRFFGSKRRPLPESAKGGCFVEDARGRWWVCFHVEVTDKPTNASGEVGVDLGLKSFATLSTGESIEPPHPLRKLADGLAIAQRANNKRRTAAIHAKIANQRRDHHHKLSTRLSREYALIAVGDVQPKQLAKTRMAKSTHDAGWSAFRKMLAYKAATYVEVDEKFTTQTCSSCGALPPERPKGIAGLGIRVWNCSSCGASHDRDVNAAKNILRLGRGVAPLVEESLRAA